ncbi:MAG: hypothetical protein ACTHXA_03060 [Gulosibacter sp.]|uniref:hypothetical protein n=1 Tax=Gulosibacter sp. TaxID=2817531 RepID=UPI003F917A0E
MRIRPPWYRRNAAADNTYRMVRTVGAVFGYLVLLVMAFMVPDLGARIALVAVMLIIGGLVVLIVWSLRRQKKHDEERWDAIGDPIEEKSFEEAYSEAKRETPKRRRGRSGGMRFSFAEGQSADAADSDSDAEADGGAAPLTSSSPAKARTEELHTYLLPGADGPASTPTIDAQVEPLRAFVDELPEIGEIATATVPELQLETVPGKDASPTVRVLVDGQYMAALNESAAAEYGPVLAELEHAGRAPTTRGEVTITSRRDTYNPSIVTYEAMLLVALNVPADGL